MSIVLLLIGLLILIKWADFFIDGSSGIARKAWLSPFIIGLTIVSLGTSAPELFINIQSALDAHTQLALWNILGSNISNILLVCGISAAIRWLQMSKIIHQNFSISLIFGILLGIISLASGWTIGIIGGIILLIASGIYMYYMLRTIRQQEVLSPDPLKHPHRLLILMIVWWLLVMILGSSMVVDNAVIIAQKIWLSERIIWLTVVAIGTSLPELITALMAVRKWEWEIGVGNIVGSNILNIGIIGWLTAILHPITFLRPNYFDLFVFLWATVLVLVLLFVGRRYKITRLQWGLFLLLYAVYIGYVVVMG